MHVYPYVYVEKMDVAYKIRERSLPQLQRVYKLSNNTLCKEMEHLSRWDSESFINYTEYYIINNREVTYEKTFD